MTSYHIHFFRCTMGGVGMNACQLFLFFVFFFHLCQQLIREIKQCTKRGRAETTPTVQPTRLTTSARTSSCAGQWKTAGADPGQVVIAPTIAVARCPFNWASSSAV